MSDFLSYPFGVGILACKAGALSVEFGIPYVFQKKLSAISMAKLPINFSEILQANESGPADNVEWIKSMPDRPGHLTRSTFPSELTNERAGCFKVRVVIFQIR